MKFSLAVVVLAATLSAQAKPSLSPIQVASPAGDLPLAVIVKTEQIKARKWLVANGDTGQ